MQWTRKAAVVVGVLFLASTYASSVHAATGLCIREAGFSQVWELKILNCTNPDCLIEMDRVAFFPIPSAGAARLDPSLWHFAWNGNFGGATQGTVQYACDLTPTGALPFTGPGMVQRIANFSPGGIAEFLTGTCTLDVCTRLGLAKENENLTDEATQP